MSTTRSVKAIYRARPTREGAGVHLRRVFGYEQIPEFDPFLMLDDFRSDEPEHFLKGFPWHPHRGIETVTYLLRGEVEHADSMGNSGVIGSRCAQWMTAGGGIIHQEMPLGDGEGHIEGFQLWVNMPATQKMMQPRYQGVSADEIPLVVTTDGVAVRVIAGSFGEIKGPVCDIVTEPLYLDITVPPDTRFELPVAHDHTVFAYVIAGSGSFADAFDAVSCVSDGSVALFDDGDTVALTTGTKPARVLLCSGKPLGEPIAWGGPIVMNTHDELEAAFDELERGTFVAKGAR
jgi:redox-sensitive bicupin YhaK (pirin superfamily)